MSIIERQAELIKVLEAEVIASRAYFRSMDPKPGPENLFRAWISASMDSREASAEFRHAMDELMAE